MQSTNRGKIDADVVARVREGDREAFGELVRTYQRQLHNLAFRITGNLEDAQDVVQQSFLKSFQNLHKFKGNSSFGTWIYRITCNAALTLLNNRKRETGMVSDRPIEGSRDDGFKAIEQKQTVTVVRRAIEKLPERQRLALILRTYDNLQYNEIAEILECSVGAVKANYFHAITKIRKDLSPYAETGEADQ